MVTGGNTGRGTRELGLQRGAQIIAVVLLSALGGWDDPEKYLRLSKLSTSTEWAFEALEETNHVISIYCSSIKNVI